MKTHYIYCILFLIFYITGCTSQEESADAYGNFEANTVNISAETNGKILHLWVEEGGQLEAGQLVALIDTTQLHLQRMRILATINTLPEKLRNSIDEIAVLQEKKANLVRERDRVARLIEKNAALPKDLDVMNGEIDVVDKQIDALRAQTQTTNSAILSEKGPLIAEMELVNDQIRRSRIYNPIDGVVLTKLSEPHEMVVPGAPLYRIAPLDPITFRCYVDAIQLQDLKLGQNVEVLVDRGEDEMRSIPGRISWISHEAEFTPRTIQTKEERVNLVYAVKVTVPNKDGTLRVGMPGELNLRND